MRLALAIAVASGGLFALTGSGSAEVAGKPDLSGVIKAFEDAQKAERKAYEEASPSKPGKADPEFEHAKTLLESALRLLGKQPVTDVVFDDVAGDVYCAEHYDSEFQLDGYRDPYDFKQGEKCKERALWFLHDIAKTGEAPPVSLTQATTEVTAAFVDEDKAREAWKKHDAKTASTQLEASQKSLEAAQETVRKAARQGVISGSQAEGINGHLSQAHVDDTNAINFMKGANPDVTQIATWIEDGMAAKDKAVTAIEHAIANPTKTKPGESPLSVELTAVFVPADRATKYTAEVSDKDRPPLYYQWKLRLIRIDAQGSSPPGFQSKDPKAPSYASAGFDATCNNAKLAGGNRTGSDAASANYVWNGLKGEFVWYHGDVGSYPGSGYGCDHTKMGKRGHQGTVTLIVRAGAWTCRAEIFGSNLTDTPEHSPPATCTRG